VGDFCIVADLVQTVRPYKKVCRDSKDDYLLAIAEAAKAHLLVSGDRDLLVLGHYGKTRILAPGAFMKEFF
jgi:uncharacterized protein